MNSLRTRTARKTLTVAGLILGLGVAVTGCDPGSAVVSSDGHSFTVAPGTTTSPSASPSRTASAPGSPAPTVTVTQTPAPAATPATTEPAAVTAVSTCLPPAPTSDYLRALATTPQARADLATCLQVPDAPGFEDQVALYAFEALQSGEFRTAGGRDSWTSAGGFVRCPDGRTVRSLNQIYSQYS